VTVNAGGHDDRDIRRRVLSAEESFIVQAPAGSGKTELLIQRCLNLLAHVREPEEIVAITFTRKAAGEMRERVMAALRRARAGEAAADDVDGARLELARRAVDNDRRHGWDLLSYPARLQIHTIDALCLSLTRQLPYLSGFGAPSGLLDDPDAAYRRAAAAALRLLGDGDPRWRDDLARFLIHLDNDMTRATGLLTAMLASRDQWLRYLGDERMSAQGLERAWRNLVDNHLLRIDASLADSMKTSLVACADAAAGQLAGRDSPGADAWLAGGGFPPPAAHALPRWRFLAELLVTRSAPQWRRQVNKNQGFPPRSEAKEAMQALLASLADEQTLAGLLYTLRSLPEPGFDEEQSAILNAMVTVLRLAVAQLRLVFEEMAQVDFVEVTQRANHALGALEAPSDLALKLDYRIQHLLVDEFQDTSMSQYNLLRLLTQGWALDDGRTLFLVGDPMQSIYRFREAEVGVFLRVWEDGLNTVPVTPLSLQRNFRSAPSIVEWVNGAFAACFPARSDIQSGAVAYAPSAAGRPAADGDEGVHLHAFVDRPESERADRLAALVGAALERSGDVAVLVRARSHLRPLIPALQARGIPFTGMDITALINEPAVRDLHSLTRALLHPGDRMAWLALLRAPWCGLLLHDLVTIAEADAAVIWSALRDPAVLAGVSEDGRRRIERLVAALAGAMDQRGRLALRRWVRRAWVELAGPAVIEAADLNHVQAYFDLLGRHETGMHLRDEAAFEQALHGQWSHAETRPGAVQLMTIHRAKGLEFEEVFLPGLERAPRGDDKRLLLWEEPSDGRGLLLATLSARGAPDDLHYRHLRALQAQKASNEDDRLLYVACTRARERLHLVAAATTRDGMLSTPRQGSLLARLWPRLEAGIETGHGGERAAAAPEAEAGNTAAAVQPLRRVPADWSPPVAAEPLPVATPAPMDEQRVEFSWVGETARHVGMLVHEVLQRIAVDGLDRWDEARLEAALPAWRERLHHIGVPGRELEHAVRRAADSVRNVLRDRTAAWLLDAAHEETADELELSTVEGGRVRRLRIDRTFVDANGVRWIIDYKTSAHEGGGREAFLDDEVRRYHGQMETYARAFRSMESRDIRLGLYFPLLEAWREWEYAE